LNILIIKDIDDARNKKIIMLIKTTSGKLLTGQGPEHKENKLTSQPQNIGSNKEKDITIVENP
jgi:hypothetical protein